MEEDFRIYPAFASGRAKNAGSPGSADPGSSPGRKKVRSCSEVHMPPEAFILRVEEEATYMSAMSMKTDFAEKAGAAFDEIRSRMGYEPGCFE